MEQYLKEVEIFNIICKVCKSIPQIPTAFIPHNSNSFANRLFSLNLSAPIRVLCTTIGFIPSDFNRTIVE